MADGEANAPRSFQPMNVNFGLFPPLERAPATRPAGACAGPRRRR